MAIVDLVESAGTGSTEFRAQVTRISLTGSPAPPGLAARVSTLHIREAQHLGLLMSALCKVQATAGRLRHLHITCGEDGDCGCDEKAPHFPAGLVSFSYDCRRVKDLTSVSHLGNSLIFLDLSGCRSVEVWPDFATMTSLGSLFLNHTPLKELPTGVRLIPDLVELRIEGCCQIPAEEMVKASICNELLHPSSRYCCRASLESLLVDLRGHARDRCSVADALDSQWPKLVALFDIEQRRSGYLTEIFIRLMYELWFEPETEAIIMNKMRGLLCSETFMSLPFYVWRIGRTRDEQEEYPLRLKNYDIYMALALVGAGSIGYFNASVNDDLKDRIVNFLQYFADAPPKPLDPRYAYTSAEKELKKLVTRVADAMCKMVRVPGVAAELGEDFVIPEMR